MSLQKKLNKSEIVALMSFGAKLVLEYGVYNHYFLVHNGETLSVNKSSARSLFHNDKRTICTTREGFYSFCELKTK
jgi:hypothetical protein